MDLKHKILQTANIVLFRHSAAWNRQKKTGVENDTGPIEIQKVIRLPTGVLEIKSGGGFQVLSL